jgi:adenylate cyclase
VSESQQTGSVSEEFWRDFLTKGSPREQRVRRLYNLLPSPPRCRMCAAPFAGPGAVVMRLLGKRRSDRNPNWCTSCFSFISQHRGGAEIESTFLFADVRGSTALAEQMSATELRHLMERFYDTAAGIVFDHDGIVDKFVGDELVAMFIPLFTGRRHAARGVEAARALLHATGHGDPGSPWVPVGAGVHTGTAWVGAVGSEARTELTALGDAVNTTARLASAAGAGEILVTSGTAAAAGVAGDLERRSLELKGKQQLTEVVVLLAGPSGG